MSIAGKLLKKIQFLLEKKKNTKTFFLSHITVEEIENVIKTFNLNKTRTFL